MKKIPLLCACLLLAVNLFASGLDGLSRLTDYQTRSISPENRTGAPGAGGMADPGIGKRVVNVANAAGAARELGKGWKVNPYLFVNPGETVELAAVEGQGFINQIWLTIGRGVLTRHLILRMYWDGETEPSVETPVSDFFCNAMEQFGQVSSLAVCVNPGNAYNCYWKMPFRKGARVTIENIGDKRATVYYQVNYALGKVADDEAYFHAQFRRSNPTQGSLHTIVDGIRGKGQYVGTYMFWRVLNNGWWGEGEVKFYIDGDTEFPTVCGTGTEDYFCGSYNFENRETKQYQAFTTPYAGVPQVIRPDGVYQAVTAFGMYRWHITDPVYFGAQFKATVQDLGWMSDGRYLPQKSDISSVAFWYQTEPHAKFPPLPSKNALEIN